jgi:hypothetical protein
LIIATGSHQSIIYEFVAGVNALVDAIRVSKKIPSAFPEAVKKSTSEKRKMRSSKTSSADLNFPRKIDNIKSRKMSGMQKRETSGSLNVNTRLYEVQI